MESERDVSFTLVDSDEANDDSDTRPKDLRRRYLDLMDAYPLVTKSLTSAIIGAVAAMIVRASSAGSSSGGGISKRKHGIQWLDVYAYAICGGIQGPLTHYWYNWWEQNGPESQSNSMLVDQFFIQPPLILLLYVSLDVVKAGLREVTPAIQRSMAVLGPVVVSSWRFWPLALYCTGRLIKKRKNRVVVLKFWTLLWAAYISKQRQCQSVHGDES